MLTAIMPIRDRAKYFRERDALIREAEGREKQASGSRTESELIALLAVDAYGQRLDLFPKGDVPADPIYGDHRPTLEHLESVGVRLSAKKIGRHEEVPFFQLLVPSITYRRLW